MEGRPRGARSARGRSILAARAAIVGAANLLVAKDDVEPYTHDWAEDFVAVVEAGLATVAFGHAADGNLHLHVYRQGKGEHGVGVAPKDVPPLRLAPASLAARRAVKNALDPLGILNPGKIFPRGPLG
jgi:FAD/FMN-containing dehydrogenase